MKKEKLVPISGTDVHPDMLMDIQLFGRSGRGAVCSTCVLSLTELTNFSGAVPNRLTTLMHIHVGAFTYRVGAVIAHLRN